MLLQNSGDVVKARSNHWFFTYTSGTEPIEPRRIYSHDSGEAVVSGSSYMRRFGYYLLFVSAAVLALYTQILATSPTRAAFRQVSLEAYGFRHVMLRSRHERLARKYRLIALRDEIDGYKARFNAARGEFHSKEDALNATKMLMLAKQSWEEAQDEKEEAGALKQKVHEEHEKYISLLHNASVYQQRAEALQKEAQRFANESKVYRDVYNKYNAAAREDEELEDAYLYNSTIEGQMYENITKAEEDRKDHIWICRWGWSRQYICGLLGGTTALGEGRKWHEKQEEDYQKAMDLQQQVQLEEAKAMIASAKAKEMEEKARYDSLKAGELHNETVLDEVEAAQEHLLEVHDLQQELEDLKSSHEHLLDLQKYETLHVKLETQSRKEDEYAHGQWELGSELLKKGEQEQLESDEEYEFAKKEAATQAELLERARKLRRQLRMYSLVATLFALTSLAFFATAIFTTDKVSLAYHAKLFAAATSLTCARNVEARSTYWEGRSILGNHQDRNALRQLSIWFHHVLCFLVVVGIQGDALSCIFSEGSLRMRGELLLSFSTTAGLLKTLVFQAIPHASVLHSLNQEYFRNILIRFAASTCCYTVQLLLLLVVCGQDSTWLFNCMELLHRSYIFWIMLFVTTSATHLWMIEYPHALALDSNNGAGMSDVTFSTFSHITVDKISHDGSNTSLLAKENAADEEGLPRPAVISETDSLITVSHADAPAPPSIASPSYSSIALTDASASDPSLLPSPALQRLYEVSIQDEFFCILAHIEMGFFAGVILVAWTNVMHH